MMRAPPFQDDLDTANAERDAAIAGRDAAITERDAARAAYERALAERGLEIGRALYAEQRLNAASLGFANWLGQKRVLLGMLRRAHAGRVQAMRAAAMASGAEAYLSRGLIAEFCQTRVLLGLLRRPAAFCQAMVAGKMRDAARGLQGGSGAAPLPLGQAQSFHRNPSRFDPSRENIILVIHEASRTGAPILGWNIIRSLARRYNIFTVRLGGGALTAAFEALSAETHGPFLGADRNAFVIEDGLRPLFEKRRFRYAIINSAEARILLKLCARQKIPTIFLIHEFATYVHPVADLRRAFEDAAEIVFPAQIVAASSRQVYPALQSKSVNILPQGVSDIPAGAEAFDPELAGKCRILAQLRAEGAFIVIGIGTVSFRKGVDLFIGAAAAARRGDPKRRVHFVWVGPGYAPEDDMAYSVYLKEQIERAGLAAAVTFLGEVSDMEPAYGLADMFFLSSRLDPLPNVSIDAAIRGIPILCFAAASGMAELLAKEPETAACVVAHLDVDAAAGFICRLAEDAAEAAGIAAATARMAQNTFNMELYVEQLDRLGRRHGPPGLQTASPAGGTVA